MCPNYKVHVYIDRKKGNVNVNYFLCTWINITGVAHFLIRRKNNKDLISQDQKDKETSVKELCLKLKKVTGVIVQLCDALNVESCNWCVLNKNNNDNKGNLRALAKESTLITNSATVPVCANIPSQC